MNSCKIIKTLLNLSMRKLINFLRLFLFWEAKYKKILYINYDTLEQSYPSLLVTSSRFSFIYLGPKNIFIINISGEIV